MKIGVFGLKIGIFANFDPLYVENWFSDFRFFEPFARTPRPLSILRTRARGLFTVSRKIRSNLEKKQFRRISPDMRKMRYLAKYISGKKLAMPGLLSV